MLDILLPLLILGVLGILFGCLLGYASKKFAVEKDPLYINIREALPGANCGACGYAGCDAYAKAVAASEAAPNRCSVGGQAAADAIAQCLGVEAAAMERQIARVACKGGCAEAPDKAEYYGIADCREAAMTAGGGTKACRFGCLGLGTCEAVCPFGAIHVHNGVAETDPEKCTGCGACTKACPRQLIQLVPEKEYIYLPCSSQDRGKEVKQVCSVGCIGCGLCAKACPQMAITMEKNRPVIQRDICLGCNSCVEKCPTGILQNLR